MIVEMARGPEAKIGREFHRIEGVRKELARYPDLHRKLDGRGHQGRRRLPGVRHGSAGLRRVGPKRWPRWEDAANTDAWSGRCWRRSRSLRWPARRRALQEFREATAKRHKILSSMAPAWKEMQKSHRVARAVSARARVHQRIDGFILLRESACGRQERDSRPGLERDAGLRGLAAVMAVAMGGAFVNFNLIALPMSESSSGSRIAGMPVSTVAPGGGADGDRGRRLRDGDVGITNSFPS